MTVIIIIMAVCIEPIGLIDGIPIPGKPCCCWHPGQLILIFKEVSPIEMFFVLCHEEVVCRRNGTQPCYRLVNLVVAKSEFSGEAVRAASPEFSDP